MMDFTVRKKVLMCCMLLSFLCMNAQKQIIYVSPESLVDQIKKSNKASVVQYWVPNCENNKEIMNQYKELESQYGEKIDFYFIGLTEIESLVSNLIQETKYPYKSYIIYKDSDELILRKQKFSKSFLGILNEKKQDFITIYLNNEDKLLNVGNDIDIDKKKLKKLTTQF